MLKKLFLAIFFSVFLNSLIPYLLNSSVFAYTEKTYYIHQDNLGSVVATTDENGNPVTENLYNSYGSSNSPTTYPLQPTTSPPTERGYTGQIQDSSTSLQYYNARYYDPILSRFISADSQGNGNRYAYVSNNPISNSDPTGNKIVEDDGGANNENEEKLGRKKSYTPPINTNPLEYQAYLPISYQENLYSVLWKNDEKEYDMGTYMGYCHNCNWFPFQKKIITSILNKLPGKFYDNFEFIQTVFGKLSVQFNGKTEMALAWSGAKQVYLPEDTINSRSDITSIVVHELAHANLLFGYDDSDSDAKDLHQYPHNFQINNQNINQAQAEQFLGLRGWFINSESNGWQSEFEPWFSKNIMKDYRFQNPNEDLAVGAEEYFANSATFRQQYGDRLADWYKNFFYGKEF